MHGKCTKLIMHGMFICVYCIKSLSRVDNGVYGFAMQKQAALRYHMTYLSYMHVHVTLISDYSIDYGLVYVVVLC